MHTYRVHYNKPLVCSVRCINLFLENNKACKKNPSKPVYKKIAKLKKKLS